MKELEAEVDRLRMENELLKKAAAFFARTGMASDTALRYDVAGIAKDGRLTST